MGNTLIIGSNDSGKTRTLKEITDNIEITDDINDVKLTNNKIALDPIYGIKGDDVSILEALLDSGAEVNVVCSNPEILSPEAVSKFSTVIWCFNHHDPIGSYGRFTRGLSVNQTLILKGNKGN